MRRFNSCVLLFAIVLFVSRSTLFAQVDFSEFYTFGDSLTDNDAQFLGDFFGTDPSLYGFDPMEAVFNKAADREDHLTSFAVLGSRSSDVLTQVKFYLDARQSGAIPAATMFSIQGGANDFLDLENDSANLVLLASFQPGQSAAADAIVSGVIRNLLASIKMLQSTDNVPVVLWTIPDLTLTPYSFVLGFGPEHATNIQMHLDRVNGVIRSIGKKQNVTVVDTFHLLTSLTDNPVVVEGVTIEPAPAFGYATALFADPIHPTQIANAMIANQAILAINVDYDDKIQLYSEQELAAMAGL